MSRPYAERVSGEVLDSQRCIQNSLTKLDNLIQEHHAEDDIMFWADLASCHYAMRDPKLA